MGFIVYFISESKSTALIFTFHLTSDAPYTEVKSWASDVKLDHKFITKSYQSQPCSSAGFYWDTSACVVSLHAAVLHKQTFFLQVGIRSRSHIKAFCFSVNHTILLCSSALAHTATASFIPPLTPGVSAPFRETVIPGSPVPPAHSSPRICANL